MFDSHPCADMIKELHNEIRTNTFHEISLNMIKTHKFIYYEDQSQ